MDTGEPFGLPRGTVRGIIALAFSAVTLYLFATGQSVDTALLSISTLIIGNYFGSRTSENATTAAASAAVAAYEQVGPPYIPGDPK